MKNSRIYINRYFAKLGGLVLLSAIPVLFSCAPSEAAAARCFLSGSLLSSENAKASIFDNLRLNFDAKEKVKCEEMMASYCFYNVKEKNYSPARLVGLFATEGEEVKYQFSNDCSLSKI